MAGLKAMFNMQAVRQVLQEKVESIGQETLQALQYAGEEFVNRARQNGNYTDDTGNLRSSIGYVILKDGRVVDSNFSGRSDDGIAAAKMAASEVGADFPRGIVLIGVAGMNYAAAVESRGYDVITGSAPQDNDIKDLMGAIKI